MADTDVLEGAGLALRPDRVGQSEVRMADHSEDVGHPPVDKGLDHRVAHRARSLDLFLQTDIDAVAADLDRVGRHPLVVARRRLARERAVVPAMPRATQPAVLDRSLPQRATLVRTAVVQRAVLPVVVRQANGAAARHHRLDPVLGQLVEVGDLEPGQAGGGVVHQSGSTRMRRLRNQISLPWSWSAMWPVSIIP